MLAPITVNLVAGAKHRDLALKFIDFSIRAEASKGWAEALRYTPTNKDAKLAEDVASQAAAEATLKAAKAMLSSLASSLSAGGHSTSFACVDFVCECRAGFTGDDWRAQGSLAHRPLFPVYAE